jgi:hypothetical protein
MKNYLMLSICLFAAQCVSHVGLADQHHSRSRRLAQEFFTPSISARGVHTCSSGTDTGQTCEVFGIDFDDCEQAKFQLQHDDCCPSVQICDEWVNDTLTLNRLCLTSHGGGSSVRFTMMTCVRKAGRLIHHRARGIRAAATNAFASALA